jgi:hypothetical protein
MVFFAAPDIILDVEAEKKNAERAAQIYANNASRVMAIRPGGKSVKVLARYKLDGQILATPAIVVVVMGAKEYAASAWTHAGIGQPERLLSAIRGQVSRV